jgi:MFS family permease
VLARLLHLDRNNALLVLANLVWGIGSGVYAAIWPLFVESLGASPVEIGIALSLTTAVSAVVFIPGAALTQRLGRKQAMLLGWSMGPLSSLVFALAASWQHLLPGIVLLALVGVQAPAYLGYIATAAQGRELPRVYSLMTSAVSLGTVVSSPVGGWLADLWDMRLLFWGVAGAYGLATLCVLKLERLEDDQPDAGEGRTSPAPMVSPAGASSARQGTAAAYLSVGAILAGYSAVLTDRRLMAPLLVQLALLAGANLAQPLAPNWLVSTYGYSRAQIGALGALAALASIAWGLILSRLASRRGASTAMLAAAALVMLGAIALLGASSLLVGAIAHVLRGGFTALRALSTGLTAALLRPAMEPAIAEAGGAHAADHAGQGASAVQVRRPGHVERGFAVYSTLLNVALALSTVAAGALYQINPALPFALSAASVLPVALLLWVAAYGSRWGGSPLRLRMFATAAT